MPFISVINLDDPLFLDPVLSTAAQEDAELIARMAISFLPQKIPFSKVSLWSGQKPFHFPGTGHQAPLSHSELCSRDRSGAEVLCSSRIMN